MRWMRVLLPAIFISLVGCWVGTAVLFSELGDDSSSGAPIAPPTPFSLVNPPDTKPDVLGTTPTFTWADSTGERRYILEVSGSLGFGTLLFTDDQVPEDQTSYTIPTGNLIANQTYYWRVFGWNEGGQEMAGPFSFTALPKVWAKVIGGAGGDDELVSVEKTSDGGYVMAGSTEGTFGDTTKLGWTLKLNSDSTVAWQRYFGGPRPDSYKTFRERPNGEFVAMGVSESWGNNPATRMWFTLMNSDGTSKYHRAWAVITSGVGNGGYDIQPTSDGGFIGVGQFSCCGPDHDYRVTKFDEKGAIVWDNAYGNPSVTFERNRALSVQETASGGFTVAGYVNDWGVGGYNFWILSLDSLGNIIWERTYGGGGDDQCFNLQNTSDGGFIVCGYTDSFGAGGEDAWVIKLNSNGTIAWENTYGGGGNERAQTIRQTAEGGYVVAGQTDSWTFGLTDFWVFKIDASGTIQWENHYGGPTDEQAMSIVQDIDDGYVVVGPTDSFGVGGKDTLILKLDSLGDVPTLTAPTTATVQPAGISSQVTTANFGAIFFNTPAAVFGTGETVIDEFQHSP